MIKKVTSYIFKPLLICIFIVILLLLYIHHINTPTITKLSYCSFSHPKSISIQTLESSSNQEVIFFDSDQQVGGINCYPSITKNDFYNNQDSDEIFETFLRTIGLANQDDSIEAYMLDSSIKSQIVELWEMRNGIERTHYFFFNESNLCIDLWFYCDKLSDSTIKNIKDSFQLEVSI